MKEINSIVERDVPMPKILVSDRAQMVMSYHKNFDAYEEERLGGKSFGSTKSGIAPFYSDKYAKIGFQVSELFDDDLLKEKVVRVAEQKNVLLEHLYHKPLLNADEIFAELMKYKYGVDVSDRTLRNWCSKLISSNIIQKCGKQTYWKTEIYGKEKYRSNVDPDDEDMARYFQMKSKYLEETRKSAENLELRQSEAAAWSATYKKLWREFQCCYYTCNGLVFNAIGEDYIFEIYELAQEIAAPPTIPLPVERKITTKEEYRETWFNL